MAKDLRAAGIWGVQRMAAEAEERIAQAEANAMDWRQAAHDVASAFGRFLGRSPDGWRIRRDMNEQRAMMATECWDSFERGYQRGQMEIDGRDDMMTVEED